MKKQTYSTLLILINNLIQLLEKYRKEIPSNEYRIRNYKFVQTLIQKAIDNKTINNNNLVQLNNFKLSPRMRDNLLNIEDKIKQLSKYNSQLTELLSVKGIGISLANKLIAQNIFTISQLKKSKYFSSLSTIVQKYLTYNVLSKIPRETISNLESKINLINNNLTITFVGSYRRKKLYSSDIDVLIYAKDIQTNSIDEFLTLLKRVNPFIVISKGISKCSLFLRINSSNNYVKLDVFAATKETYASNLLYTTGSANLNIKMRAIAKAKNYTLNQNGLFDFKSNRVDLTTERDYFSILNLPYLSPEDR